MSPEFIGRERSINRESSLATEIDEILRRGDALPIIDPRTVDEILDYDENGLSR